MKPFAPQATPSGRVSVPSPDPGKGRTAGAHGKLDFAAVYQAHVQTVARWAARLGGPHADIEDITQEVFLVADRRLREFRHESQLSSLVAALDAECGR